MHYTWQVKTEGGKIIRVEAHPIPEHPRPRRCKGRVALVGDAAGYVTKCSGEGIYFAAKSGRMAAEAIVEASQVSMSGTSRTISLFQYRRLAAAIQCNTAHVGDVDI
jgi:flavin-dependent dehydrogenase